MRLWEVGEGYPFRTKLTGRTGIVCGVDMEKGVTVEWVGTGGDTARLHPEVEVDPVEGVLVRKS